MTENLSAVAVDWNAASYWSALWHAGPRLFLSCPMDVEGSRVWFTDLWNYSIIPYMLEAVREGLQVVHVCECASICNAKRFFSFLRVSVPVRSFTDAELYGRTLLPGWSTLTLGRPAPLWLNGPHCCSSAQKMWVLMATLPREKESEKSCLRATATQIPWWVEINDMDDGWQVASSFKQPWGDTLNVLPSSALSHV